MTRFETITIILSSLAVLASFISLIVNYKISRRQNKLESNLLKKQIKQFDEIENEKLKTMLKIQRIDSSLFIKNIGKSSAKSIYFEVKPQESKSSPMIRDDLEKFPFKNLDPGDSIKLYWLIDSETGTEFETSCKWINEDGSEGLKETFIS